MSNGKANDATRRAQMASAIPEEGPSSAAAKIADQTDQITAADGVVKPEEEPLSAVEEKVSVLFTALITASSGQAS